MAAAGQSGVIKTFSETDINVSVISVARAEFIINQVVPQNSRAQNINALKNVAALARANHNVLPVDEIVARVWSALLPMNLDYQSSTAITPLDDDQRLVVATAIAYNLTLIESPQPYHATLLMAPYSLTTLAP